MEEGVSLSLCGRDRAFDDINVPMQARQEYIRWCWFRDWGRGLRAEVLYWKRNGRPPTVKEEWEPILEEMLKKHKSKVAEPDDHLKDGVSMADIDEYHRQGYTVSATCAADQASQEGEATP